jgi:hypothetical protein
LRNLDPVILCHPACSGGSLIYRIIVSQFEMAGISEVTHCHQLPAETFIPTDPLHSLLVAGVIDQDTFAEIFLTRIQRAIDICKQQNRKLLIREHTHSYFFNPKSENIRPALPSWIGEQLQKRRGEDLKCIVTIRDPVDSWLGLVANFPSVAPPSFDQYSAYYLEFIETFRRNRNRNPLMLLRYEDLIDDPVRELRQVADFLDIPFDGHVAMDRNRVHSSGNSGRQSDKLERRPRRPFDIDLLRQLELSESYSELVKLLGYDNFGESVSSAERLAARLDPIEQKARFGTGRPIRALRNWLMRKNFESKSKIEPL